MKKLYQNTKEYKSGIKVYPLKATILIITMCIMLILAIGIYITRSKGTIIVADITKKEEIEAATNVGGSVTAEFTSGTGAITISGSGTIDKTEWNTFVETCGKENIKTITIQNNGVYLPARSESMFTEFLNLTSVINAQYLNTSNVTSMFDLFRGCSKLENIDVSGWDVRNVIDMQNMFADCKLLTTIDVSRWNTTNVTTMMNMFSGCEKLQSLDVSGWNTTNVTNMQYQFYKCSSLTTIDVSNWDVSNVQYMQGMFEHCGHLVTVDVSRWDTSSSTNMAEMFVHCGSLTTLNVRNFKMDNVRNTSLMFHNCTQLQEIDVSNWSTPNVKYMNNMFYNCYSVTELDLSNFVTSQVTTMGQMFMFCKGLETLTLGDFDTSKVVNISETFKHCEKLQEINISNWNTSSVTKMNETFLGCKAITTLDISGWDMRNVTEATNFMYNCNSLERILTPSNYSTQSVTLANKGDETPRWYNVTNTGDNLEYSSFKSGDFEGSVMLQRIVDYTITYNLNEGNLETENPTTYNIISETITLNEPTKTGYTFTGWTGSNGETPTKDLQIVQRSTGDKNYTANWIAKGDTPYTVKHFVQKLGGNKDIYDSTNYELIETEDTLKGVTGQTVTVPVKRYDGFISPTAREIEISADGLAQLEYYYTRRTDLSYVVNYLERGTNNVIKEQKTVQNKTFGEEINTSIENTTIYGYNYNEMDKSSLTITTGVNEINIYYIKKTAEVIVHHYLSGTTETLVDDETITGNVGENYTTTKSIRIPNNYRCVNERPLNYTGIITEEVITVNYNYELITPTIQDSIENVAVASKTKENGDVVLTKENGEVTYNIQYDVAIKNYIGKAKIEIQTVLPADINRDESRLSGGIYSPETRTIKWEEDINNIDTFTNGDYEKQVQKQITIIYQGQNLVNQLESIVQGTTTTYYPTDYPQEVAGREYIREQAEDTTVIKQEYLTNFKLETKWEDNEDKRHERPQSTTVEIKVMPNNQAITKTLNAENNWTYEERGLPKYNQVTGEKVTYIITQKETNEGDLELYNTEKQEIETQTEEVTNYTVTITNSYKLTLTDLNTVLTATTTNADITNKSEQISYTIKMTSEIEDYAGEGKVTIVDTLPYKIDLSKSDIRDGIYNDEKQTITWEEEIPYIDTDTLGRNYKINITKQIKVVYKDIDLSQAKMTNTVKATVELYATDQEDKAEKSIDTAINVKGRVIVKYVDNITGDKISEDGEIVDKIGNAYSTQPKEITGYDYIKSTNNENGTISERDKEVIYYYELTKTKVIAKYQDKEGNKLAEDKVIKAGYEGDTYKSEKIEIENYRHVETKGQEEGTIGKEQIEIIYVYEKKSAKVIIKYLDHETETELLPSKTIEGYIGDSYETTREAIQYYKSNDSEPENARGKMTGEPIEVKYYYKKLDFNFSIYKRINSAKLNGKEIKITDDNIIKIEIPNKDIKSTELIVSYNIKITNKGELDGKATIEQQIPVGYEVVDATINSPEDGWTLTSDRTLERQVELAAGQTKEIQMTLRWTNNEDNLGTKTIISSIKSSENIANYSDTNKEDDSKTITIIVGIKTGLTSNMNIQTVLLLMVLLLVSAGMEIFVTKL